MTSSTRQISYRYHSLWNVLNQGRPYEPFDWQIQHLHAQVDAGYKTIALPCGRRAGKSTGVVAETARESAQQAVIVRGISHAPIIYIIGPTAETSMRVFQPVWNAFVPPDSGSYIPPLGFLYDWHDKNRGLITLKNGTQIFRKTADDPRSLQGERVTLAIADEAHDINEEAWENLLPALADSDGRIISIGVAKGRGRFRSMYFAGQGMDSSIYSASVPTSANPIFQDKAAAEGMETIEWIRKQPWAESLTDEEFERQILAKWTDEEGQVFARFEQHFTGHPYPTDPDGLPGVPEVPHIMSLDLGKIHDFTVAYVGNVAEQRFVARERFNKIDYVDQVPRLADLYHRYKCKFIHMDTNGPGEAPSEMLRDLGCKIVPFMWSNSAKAGLVSTMVREVQRGNVTFLADDTPLKKEMSMFEGTVTTGGLLRYEAPKGFYDDCVIAAALLISKMVKTKVNISSGVRRNYLEAVA